MAHSLNINSEESAAALASLPPEIWDITCQYMGQAASHALLRTCRTLYWAVGPIAWRKVVLAPNPEWVAFEPRPPGDPSTFDREIGQVKRGFVRSKRLVDAWVNDVLLAQERGDKSFFRQGRWQNLSDTLELTICDYTEPLDMANLFGLFPRLKKANIYMGNFLYWYMESIGGPDTGWEILPYNRPTLPELLAASGSSNPILFRPRTMCEVMPLCMNRDWLSDITYLNIDCEAHLQADLNTTRASLTENLWEAHIFHNTNPYAWYEAFPNVQTLKCGVWFLDLLWKSTYTHGRDGRMRRPATGRLRAMGIGQIPKHNQWQRMRTLIIQGYEDECPEVEYRRVRSIVPRTYIWTFLGTFKGLKTIRCEVGPWKRLHRYPGGFEMVPHIESLSGLAALQICQRKHGWDVAIEDFMIALRDIESLTTDNEPLELEPLKVPVLRTAKELASLLDFIRGIGWTGYVSVPDTTQWWNGPTWRFWLDDVEVPNDSHPMGDHFSDSDEDENPGIEDWLPWKSEPDDDPTCVKVLLEHYIGALDCCQDWKHLEKGLYIYHESCWYRSFLHPKYRHMANAQYDEQLILFLSKNKQRLKGLSIATNNWTAFADAWKVLQDEITSVCFDAFDYRVREIIEDPQMPDLKCRPRFDLRLYHARSDTYDFLGRMKNLKHLAIVNFQWPFDPVTTGAADQESGDGPFGEQAGLPHIEDILEDCKSLQVLKLVGDIYYRIPPPAADPDAHLRPPFEFHTESARKHLKSLVRRSFKNWKAHEHKIDLEYMRFKYVHEAQWEKLMQPGPIDKNARAQVYYELNDIPALNRHPPWGNWDLIKQWKEVETQGWKIYEEMEGYPVHLDEMNMYLDLAFGEAGYIGSLEEKLAAWSARLHHEKDAPFDPILQTFVKWHESEWSRFRMDVRDFHTIPGIGPQG